MLQELRAKTHGLVAKILLGLIVIAFSFFGIESYFVAQTNDYVAKVGDKEISQQDFRTRFDEFRQQQLQAANGAIDAQFFEQPAIKRRILDQLIDEQVLLVANEKLGIAIPAEQLRDQIAKIPAFQREGVFDPALYRARLSSQGLTPLGFDNRVAMEMATREIPVAVASSAFVTEVEVNDYLRLRGQLRDFRFVTLFKPQLTDDKIAEEEIASYYAEHSSEYMNAEQVAIDYLEIDAAKLDVKLTADEATLRDRYEKEKTRFVSSEQRLASHILIKVGGSGDPEEQKKALEKAQKIAEEARSGKDFAELAKASSEDLGSRALGGDLGWLDKGMTDPAFEGALYALEEAKISDPVLSPEGYHIIEVRDIRPGKTRTFEEVRVELASDFGESERERVYNEKSGRMIDLTYEDSTSLEPAAKELDLKVERTALFSRMGGTGIAANPGIVQAAFSDQVLVQGNNSDQVELGPNHLAIIRVGEHKAATPKAIEEVRADIQRRIIEARLSKQAKTRADELFARLQNGDSIDALAAELKLEVTEERDVGRDAVKLDAALVKAAFDLPWPDASNKAPVQIVALAGDEYALIKLDNVANADPTAVAPPTRESARTTLQQSMSNGIARDFVAALRAGMDVQVVEDRM